MIEFADLRRRYPTRPAAHPPGWTLPTIADFEQLQGRYRCRFPPSFVRFQTSDCQTTPMGGGANAFGWASPDAEPHMRLELILQEAQEVGVPSDLVPFHHDEGNFLCFATQERDRLGEFPVVFWDHDEHGTLVGPENRWPNFVAWLAADLEDN